MSIPPITPPSTTRIVIASTLLFVAMVPLTYVAAKTAQKVAHYAKKNPLAFFIMVCASLSVSAWEWTQERVGLIATIITVSTLIIVLVARQFGKITVSSPSTSNSSTTKTTLNFEHEELVSMARKGELDEENPVYGRDEELKRLMTLLTMKQKNNVILIGAPGVGKTALVRELAKKIARNDPDIPKSLQGREIVSLTTTELFAGGKWMGEIEGRISSLLTYLKTNNALLFLDEAHTICRRTNGGGTIGTAPVTLIDQLKPYLQSHGGVIAATTTTEYDLYIKRERAMVRRFQNLSIEPMKGPATHQLLIDLRSHFEKEYALTIPDLALRRAVSCTALDRNRFWPDKALDFLHQVCAKAVEAEDPEVTEEHVAYVAQTDNV